MKRENDNNNVLALLKNVSDLNERNGNCNNNHVLAVFVIESGVDEIYSKRHNNNVLTVFIMCQVWIKYLENARIITYIQLYS